MWGGCVCLCVQNYLKEPGEDVKLEHWDVIIAGEVNGGLEGHGLQSRAYGMELMEWLTKHLPRHNGPVTHRHNECIYIKKMNFKFIGVGYCVEMIWGTAAFKSLATTLARELLRFRFQVSGRDNL